MSFRIMAFAENGFKKIQDWEERPGRGPAERTWKIHKWKNLARNIFERARRGSRSPMLIFICLGTYLFIRKRENETLDQLLSLARKYGWGSDVYLVGSADFKMSQEMNEFKDHVQIWMQTALEGRVSHFLQIHYVSQDVSSIEERKLRAAYEEARQREILITKVRSRHSWACVFSPKRKVSKKFMDSVSWDDLEDLHRTNPLLVVDKENSKKQLHFVKKMRRRYSNHAAVAVTIQVESRIDSYCLQENLPLPLYFEGELELWYFLLRLNEINKLWPLPEPDRVKAVIPASCSILISPTTAPRRMVLVTSALNPSMESERECLRAGHEMGRVLRQVPLLTFCHLEPAVTPVSLRRMFDRYHSAFHRPPNSIYWIHIGPSEGGQIRDAQGRFYSSRRWIHWLKDESGSDEISMLLLLSSGTAEAAHEMARCGARVAVGFENEVRLDIASEFAALLLNEALLRPDDGDSILKSFDACRKGWTRINRFRPTAFHAGLR